MPPLRDWVWQNRAHDEWGKKATTGRCTNRDRICDRRNGRRCFRRCRCQRDNPADPRRSHRPRAGRDRLPSAAISPEVAACSPAGCTSCKPSRPGPAGTAARRPRRSPVPGPRRNYTGPSRPRTSRRCPGDARGRPAARRSTSRPRTRSGQGTGRSPSPSTHPGSC